ncbi:hypothetical protein F4808DRAFT_470889 [Astrocystis sublimbata]|nr:hypothetical protein F4808DRAFT_470889 [Astrocystis sublimbata]
MSDGRVWPNDTVCEQYYGSGNSFLEPQTSSVFEPGDSTIVQWFAGIVSLSSPPAASAKATQVFNLAITSYRNESESSYIVRKASVHFSGNTTKDDLSWTYITEGPCPSATEISYLWHIPNDFMAVSETDFDYVLIVETETSDGDLRRSSSMPFRILVHSSDPAISSTSSATDEASMTPESNPIGGFPPGYVNPHRSRNHGLSTGAKAGIAVGSVLGGLALILLFVWAFYRRRRKLESGELGEETPGPPTTVNAYSNTNATTNTNTEQPGATDQKAELDSRQIPTESGGAPLYELEAFDTPQRNAATVSQASENTTPQEKDSTPSQEETAKTVVQEGINVKSPDTPVTTSLQGEMGTTPQETAKVQPHEEANVASEKEGHNLPEGEANKELQDEDSVTLQGAAHTDAAVKTLPGESHPLDVTPRPLFT